jgi:hypothetical protein
MSDQPHAVIVVIPPEGYTVWTTARAGRQGDGDPSEDYCRKVATFVSASDALRYRDTINAEQEES